MTKNKGWIYVFIGIVFFTHCSQDKTNLITNPEIDTQTVLSIGKVNISAYEFEKNLKISQKQMGGQSPQAIQSLLADNLKNNFIDKTYFLADAYDKGYNNNKHIDSIVEGAARFMVSQSNGLLEQEINKDDEINDDELKKAIERGTKEFHIEYIKFKDKNSALKNMQGITANTFSGFKELIKKVDFLEVTYKKDVLTWPFKGYWGKEEEIFALKENAVSPLLKLYDGYYIIHIENINELPASAINANQIKMKLEMAKRQKTKDILNVKIYGQARPIIDDNIVNIFARKLKDYIYGSNHTFLKADFNDILPKTILTYISPLGQTKTITVNNFIDYYNTLFIKSGIKNTDDVSRNLIALCFSDYAYAEGIKKGITTQPKFLLDRNNYKNNVIYNTYTEQELADKSAITENEIIQMYNLMKPHLTQAENVVASVYYFNNQNEAIRKKIDSRSDTLTFKGLIKVNKHLTLNNKSKVLPDTLKKAVFDLNIRNNPARMIELNNQYIVLVKEKETGNRVRKLEEVKDLVIAEIKNNKLLKNQKARLAELKNKYKPKIDLTNKFNPSLAMN